MIPLLILGLLKENPGSYGYELLALMQERYFEYVIRFTKGSFYYNIQQLEEKKLIQRLPDQQEGKEKHRYVLTETGEREFLCLFEKYGSVNDPISFSFYGALLFADEAPEKMSVILETQIKETQKKIRLMEQSLDNAAKLTNHFPEMLAHSLEIHRLNLAWYQELLADYQSKK